MPAGAPRSGGTRWWGSAPGAPGAPATPGTTGSSTWGATRSAARRSAATWSGIGGPRRGACCASGALQSFGILDFGGKDRNDFVPADAARGRSSSGTGGTPRASCASTRRRTCSPTAASTASSSSPTTATTRTGRRRRADGARDGGWAATATFGIRAPLGRPRPSASPSSLWSESVPLLPASYAIGLDLSSAATITRLSYEIAEGDPGEGYAATRLDITERLYAPFDLGDVRFSPFVGGRITSYGDRNDGGDDVTRSAFEAGLRANLQLSRDWDLTGGRWRLDGLRHVSTSTAGVTASLGDDVDPADLPQFDRVDVELQRGEAFLEVRNRLETRRTVVVGRDGGKKELRRANGTLLDFRARVAFWLDDIGPYGRKGPGQIETWLTAELVPGRAWLKGSSLSAFEGATFQRSSIGVEWALRDDLVTACGFRHVQDLVLAPWYDAYWRWNEKWGVRVSGIHNFEDDPAFTFKATLLRFSPDHLFQVGFSLRNGDDVSFFINFQPAIGGTAVDSPFDPREPIDFTP